VTTRTLSNLFEHNIICATQSPQAATSAAERQRRVLSQASLHVTMIIYRDWCFSGVVLALLLQFCNSFLSPAPAPRITHAPPLAARKKTLKRRFSQEAHSGPPLLRTNNSNDRPSPKKEQDTMWQSNKSIDELEGTMTKRWGTSLEKWTADPREYEFVDQDASNDTGGVFRAKPVLDPWAEKEDETIKKSHLTTTDDIVLNRVRRNQERLQKDREPVVEFYDEDDEGYAPTDNTKDDDDDDDDDMMYHLEKLIAPRPVGGRGSKSIPEPSESASPGFFFNSNAATSSKQDENQMIEKQQEEDARKKKRRNKTSSLPVLDENDKPMFLTLEQAERDFQSASQDDDGSYAPPDRRTWEELGITSETLLMNLESMGCRSPLPVQDKACPSIATGNDVLVGTYTGSGKTLAFLVPLAQRLLFAGSSSSGTDVQVLIVAPGRELASQIVSVARSLLEGTDITAMLAIGGTTFTRNLEQIRKRKPSILVGTPGRIAELVVGKPGERSGRLKVGDLQALVLDEFDALLEYKPHRDPTKGIIASLKKRHGDSLQSILCSATASDMMESRKIQNSLRPGFAQAMADRNDRLITSGRNATSITRVSSTAIHGVIHVPHRRMSLEALRSILHTEPIPQQALIFADTAHRVDIVIEKV
jgi:hypothetical protein